MLRDPDFDSLRPVVREVDPVRRRPAHPEPRHRSARAVPCAGRDAVLVHRGRPRARHRARRRRGRRGRERRSPAPRRGARAPRRRRPCGATRRGRRGVPPLPCRDDGLLARSRGDSRRVHRRRLRAHRRPRVGRRSRPPPARRARRRRCTSAAATTSTRSRSRPCSRTHPASPPSPSRRAPTTSWARSASRAWFRAIRAAPPTLDDLRAFAADSLAHHKLPEAIVVVDALPLTAAEKVDRRALAAPSGHAVDGLGRLRFAPASVAVPRRDGTRVHRRPGRAARRRAHDARRRVPDELRPPSGGGRRLGRAPVEADGRARAGPP